MLNRRILPVLLSVAACLLFAGMTAAQTKLLRFPDIHGDKVVFTYGGDLWIASTSGGTATRLTSHPGLELFAKFSPDGKWIAFTGQYDGDEQVYIIPATGGVPKQLTFYPARGPLTPRWGYDNQVYGWSPDGKSVLFRSLREHFDLGDSRLYTVSVDGGMPVALPMPKSGAGDFAPDGKKVVYSPLFRDFRTWKRYSGGWAQQLYIFDLNSHAAEKITDDSRAHRDPMWVGGKIYYSSDKDDTLNLYVYDPATKKTEQLTHGKKWDLRWPSTDHKNQIVYELEGELNVFHTDTGKSDHISITVPTDAIAMRPSRISASNEVEGFELSPKGERAVFVARGDVFSVPIEKGATRNLTDSSNAHDKWGRWSPDGAKIAYISDADGEDEVYLVNQDGSGKPEELTHGFHAMLYAAEWAPDGKRLAFSDKDGKLFVLTLDDKKVSQIAQDPSGRLRDYIWSSDGGHIAFTMNNPNNFRSIYVWSAGDGQVHRVTGDLFDTTDIAWDTEGNYLYYIAVRDFAPQISQIEFNFATNRGQDLYALALRKDVKNPFPPESDEVTISKDGEKKDEKKDDKDKKEEKKKEYFKIDFDGLSERVTRVPVTADNYFGLTATKDGLLFAKGGAFFYGREPFPDASLVFFSTKDRKENTLAEDIQGYAVSADGKKALVRQGRAYKLYDVKPDGKNSAKNVSTDGLMVDRVPHEEWVEAFNEVWRRYRDFFYVKNMHGYDWNGLREQYRPLVDYVAHRSDLNYVLGEMVAELSIGHAYIEGGDWEMPKRPQVALMGARFELDTTAGKYKISKIYRGQNEEELYRSPLTEVGVKAGEGNYILAIDGKELTAKDNPYQFLLNKANRPVQLTLNDKPAWEGSWQTNYKPITQERNLIYLEWVTRNREIVSKATNGRVGYIHIPDMGAAGIREFIKYYYPQIRKEGLVVDVRGNGGGNVSQMLIERLRRELLGTEFSRGDSFTGTYPGSTFYGPKVCLINETSASDGDIFPYMFKQAGLGPLIGKRTWGGVVGISGHGPLIDGGTVFVPEFATASVQGQYVIEGHGVDPDIVVENEAAAVIDGKDPQLARGIAEVLKAMEASPKKLPGRPADPVKTPKR
ncbi:MAG: PD40 domain-containing protein [Acidobacteria bacterium]|nr:PD40 domain-containing protein [Acidobacteriota bacterium]MBS1867211.1 PD40 domain-containing protein [Acidobacteriota bacterium]